MQMPAMLLGVAAIISAVASVIIGVKTRHKVEQGNAVAMETHQMLNSRLDEWKAETKEAAIAAAVAAYEKGHTVGFSEGRKGTQ